jgi:transcriptional regulator of NAD metabolism
MIHYGREDVTLMDAENRRERILAILRNGAAAISAGTLSRQMGVSRQVIVGDIALLRARGSEIIATARGYAIPSGITRGSYIRKIACKHSIAETESELLAIVERGGEVVDVIVAHDLYGEITGQLNISTPQDVSAFVQKIKKNGAKLLSELTDGIHLHTLSCRDASAFSEITEELGRRGILLDPKG